MVGVLGPALEGHGKILSGLTDTMNQLAGKATVVTREGVFSSAVEQQLLQGLDPEDQYAKAPLWHRGILLMHEYPFAEGQERSACRCLASTAGVFLAGGSGWYRRLRARRARR